MYRGLISLMPKAKPLLLDLYPNAAVAYSLRKLRTAYTGSTIRVRRSSDNAEQDIAFVGNDLDTQTMLDFVGYNLWTRSEEFDNALYVKTNINTTGTPPYIDVETAPDSTLTGDKIIENATSGSHLFRRETGTIINGASYNISVYLKQAERTSVEIASQISGTLQTCILDLTNGNVSSNGFANTPVVTAEANGWYRFSVTITSGVTSQLTGLRVSLRNALNQTSYLGDGISGCFVWGTQLSQTSTVKTYQKTVATAGGAGFVTTWYDQSGNANNSTQATAANQAQIVSSGVVNTLICGKPCVTASSSRMIMTNSITTLQELTMYSVYEGRVSNQVSYFIGNSTTNSYLYAVGSTGNYLTNIGGGSAFNFQTITAVDDRILSLFRDNSNLLTSFQQKTQLTNTTTRSGNSTYNSILGVATLGFGKYSEIIWWDGQNLISQQGNISDTINNYYGIY